MKLTAALLIPALLVPMTVMAQSIGDEECDVSKRIQFTLNTSDTDAGKYIYPVMSGHPELTVQADINAYIADLATRGENDSAQFEAFSEIRFNQYNFLSLSHKAESYATGINARGPVLKCENLELDTGRIIELSDVMRSGFSGNMPRVFRAVADEKAVNRIPKYARKIIRDLGGALPISDAQSFYITRQDLVLCFEGVSLGETTIETLELPLPYGEIGKLVNPNGPLAFAIGSRPQPSRPAPIKPIPISNTRQLTETNSGANAGFPAGRTPVSPPANSALNPGSQDAVLGFTCTNGSVTHRINVRPAAPGSPHICEVEYLKTTTREILWRSFESIDFCVEKASGLANRYENRWKWNCSQRGL